MKTASKNNNGDTDFYLANIAPLNQQRAQCFCYLDMILLTVLIMEIGGLIRMILAK